jgi:hypothetical protein
MSTKISPGVTDREMSFSTSKRPKLFDKCETVMPTAAEPGRAAGSGEAAGGIGYISSFVTK